MNRLHLDNAGDTNNDEAQWAGMPPTPAYSVYQGFWTNGHPDVTQGACVRVVFDDAQFYEYAWEFVNCDTAQAFVCEAAAGLQGNLTSLCPSCACTCVDCSRFCRVVDSICTQY